MLEAEINALVLKVGNKPSILFERIQTKLDCYSTIADKLTKVTCFGGLLDVIDTLRELKDWFYIASEAFTKWKQLNPEFVLRCENGGDDVSAIELLNWQKLEDDYVVCLFGLGSVNRALKVISDYAFSF